MEVEKFSMMLECRNFVAVVVSLILFGRIELIDKDIRAVAPADPVQWALIRYENGCGMCGLTKSTPLRQRLLKSNVSKTELKLNN